MKTVLFACVHNAGRSQMAAALFNKLADPAKARAISAGTEPGSRVHPEVMEVLREVGIDVSAIAPRRLTDELASGAHPALAVAKPRDVAATQPPATRRSPRTYRRDAARARGRAPG